MKKTAIALNLFILFMLLAACGASARENLIHGALVTTNAARDDLLVYDGQHQLDIANSAKTLDEGVAKLAAYRQKREAVVRLFAEAYRAIAIAAIIKDDPTSLENLVTAGKLLADGIKELRGGK